MSSEVATAKVRHLCTLGSFSRALGLPMSFWKLQAPALEKPGYATQQACSEHRTCPQARSEHIRTCVASGTLSPERSVLRMSRRFPERLQSSRSRSCSL